MKPGRGRFVKTILATITAAVLMGWYRLRLPISVTRVSTTIHRNQWMVYYSVGGNNIDYADQMLRYSLATVRAFPENDNIDIYVIAGRRFATAISMFAPDSIKILEYDIDEARCINNEEFCHGTDPTQCKTTEFCLGVLSSMRKTMVFDIIPGIEQYKAVLFLDADIIATGPLEPIFRAITQGKEKLNVMPEGGDVRTLHNSTYWSHLDYSEQQLDVFVKKNIRAFNAGQFGFRPTTTMRRYFAELNEAIRTHSGSAFFEQSHMNVYFNPRELTTPSLEHLVGFNRFQTDKTGKIVSALVHVPDASQGLESKLNKLKAAWRNATDHYNPVRVATRNDFLERTFFTAAADKAEVIEVGGFEGQFSASLRDSLDPLRMWLIIPVIEENSTVDSTTTAAENHTFARPTDVGVVQPASKSFDADALFQAASEQFRNDATVHVLKKNTAAILGDIYTFRNRTIDLVYVAGETAYESMLESLKNALRVLKPGSGWLCGHDYSCNGQDSSSSDVVKAVKEFCHQYGFRNWYSFADACNSWAIRV